VHRKNIRGVIVVVFVTWEGGRQRHQHAPGQQKRKGLYAERQKEGLLRQDLREVSDNPEWTRKDFAKAQRFRSPTRSRCVDPQKVVERKSTYKETGFSPIVWAGAGSVQSQGAGLAVTDR